MFATARHTDTASTPASTSARDPCHFLVLRPSMALKVNAGPWFFGKGEVLDGTLATHPVNASRKVIIYTNRGTFNVNEEDVIEV